MAGDKIRITGNGKAENGTALFNGNLYKVAGFDKKDNILLSNGTTLSKDFGNIAHGYVVTSHASQGKTVDKVIISQGTNAAKAASSEQFYVSVSRGKEDISIYTDNKEQLLKNVSRSAARSTATELAEKLQLQAKESNRLKIHQRIKEGTQKAVEKVKNIIRKPSSKIIQKDEQAVAKNTGRRK
jgi:ATP-dependent exoDNAse (exonuclease V) alpha subunit